MSLKRTIYHIAGKDYESQDVVEFTFFIQRVSINNFLNLEFFKHYKIRSLPYKIGEWTIDYMHTNVDAAILPIIIKTFAFNLAEVLNLLGISDRHDIDTPYLYVRNIELRAKQSIKHERYNGIHVFDPKTKSSYLTSNSPKKIEGQQSIINGKLWRKYIKK